MSSKILRIQQILIAIQINISFMILGLVNGISGPSMIDIGNIYQSPISVISGVLPFRSSAGIFGGLLSML